MRTLQSDRCHSPGYTTGVSISEASGPPRVNWKNSSHRADQLLRVDVGSRRSFRLSTGCWICAACFGQGRASSQRRQQDGESGAAPRVAPWWILGKKGVFFRLLFHFGVGSRIFFFERAARAIIRRFWKVEECGRCFLLIDSCTRLHMFDSFSIQLRLTKSLGMAWSKKKLVVHSLYLLKQERTHI